MGGLREDYEFLLQGGAQNLLQPPPSIVCLYTWAPCRTSTRGASLKCHSHRFSPSCMPRRPKPQSCCILKNRPTWVRRLSFQCFFSTECSLQACCIYSFQKKSKKEVKISPRWSSNRIELQADNGWTAAILNSGEETSCISQLTTRKDLLISLFLCPKLQSVPPARDFGYPLNCQWGHCSFSGSPLLVARKEKKKRTNDSVMHLTPCLSVRDATIS